MAKSHLTGTSGQLLLPYQLAGNVRFETISDLE